MAFDKIINEVILSYATKFTRCIYLRRGSSVISPLCCRSLGNSMLLRGESFAVESAPYSSRVV